MRPLLVGFAAVILALAAAPARAEEPPRRVVSFNLCADQLVVALADPAQIAGLSPYAADPMISVVSEKAEAFPRIGWQAESIVPLKPDLVLMGYRDRAITRRMLDQLNQRVVELGFVTDIEGARKEVREVAALLGHPERGEALVAEIDAARKRLAAAPHPDGATAILVERGGYTAGPMSLAAALIAEAGLKAPEGAPPGFGGFVPLERLITLRPDYLIFSNSLEEPTDQGAVYLTHPAMRLLYPKWKRIILPTRYTLCGGPALVEALDYFAGVMTRLSARKR